MAAITCSAEVLVILHTAVFGVDGGLGMSMAIDALEYRVIRRDIMAISAGTPVAVVGTGVDREELRIVIPRRACPISGRVASLTRSREVSRYMVRVRSGIILWFVTSITCRWGTDISTCVAGDAGLRCMRSGEWEGGRVVVESRRTPRGSAVTRIARMAETIGDVIRILGSGEIGLVAGVAIGRGASVSCGMTDIARSGSMLSGQDKEGRVGVRGRCPSGCCMARRARMAEIGEHVIGVLPVLEIGLVACITGCGCGDISCRMTRHTSDGSMLSGERECRSAVIECRRSPGADAMTNRTIMTEAVGEVIWGLGCLESGLVAGVAVTWSTDEGGQVARGTVEGGVLAGQRKRRCRMRKT